MTEARYRGTKVVVVSPDYAGHTKFADHWLPAVAGTDGALAMAMGHVILKEFFVDRRVPYFDDYARRFTDLPILVTLREREDGTLVPDACLRASEVGDTGEHAEWRTVVLDERSGEPAVPNGSIGDRWGAEGAGRWNLDLGDIHPALSLLGRHDELAEVVLPRFDGGDTEGGTTMRRGVPARRVGGRLVATVFDLMLAH
jgi:nitrate reductase alpha subunit